MIYAFVFGVSIIFSLKITRQKNRLKDNIVVETALMHQRNSANILLIIMAAIPPFLISALRYDIGTDYFYTYAPRFQEIAAGMDSYYERGFHYLNVLISFFTDDYQWIFIVTSFLFIFFVYKSMYEQAANITMSIVMLFLTYTYFISLNNLRQSLAMSMVLFAFKYLKNKQYMKYVLWVVAAGFIHQVTFICLIFVVLDKIRLSAVAAVLIAATALLTAEKLTPLLLTQVTKIERFAMYIATDWYAERTMSRMGVLFNLCILIMLAFMEWMQAEELKKDFEWNQIVWWQCMLVCCSSLDGLLPAIYRIARVFSFVQFINLINAVEKIKSKEWKWVYYCILFAIFGIMYLQMYVTGAEEVFPYKSILF